MRLCRKSPAYRVFSQPFLEAQIMKNIKAPRHWPFVQGIHRSSSASQAFERGIYRWLANSLHKRPVTRTMLPFHDGIMPTRRYVINHSDGYTAKHAFLSDLWLLKSPINVQIDPTCNISDNESENLLIIISIILGQLIGLKLSRRCKDSFTYFL